MAAGHGDSDEADAVREQMEAPWQAMTDDERTRLRGLSADLYSVGRERPEPDHADAELAARLKALAASNAWDDLLACLRQAEEQLSPRDVAYARGLCWAHLGQPDVAIEFLREAARFRPLSVLEEVLLLTCYIHARRANEALARADEIAAGGVHPLLLLKAAEVLSVSADDVSEVQREELIGRAIQCAEVAFLMLDHIESPCVEHGTFDSLAVNALLHLALNYDYLGNRKKAIDACRRALQLSPSNPHALMRHGFLTFDDFPAAQRERFLGDFQNRLCSDRVVA
jgi:tetratricopeptide (TPR) repeat protein